MKKDDAFYNYIYYKKKLKMNLHKTSALKHRIKLNGIIKRKKFLHVENFIYTIDIDIDYRQYLALFDYM